MADGSHSHRMKRKLSILQWNCRAISNKISHLEEYLVGKPEIDVLLIQSLGGTSKTLPRLSGFYPPVWAMESDKVAVATYVRSHLRYVSLDSPENSTGVRCAWLGVGIPTESGGQINLANVYYPAGTKSEEDLAWIRRLEGDWVVAGDFNASNRLWDCTAPQNLTSDEHVASVVGDSDLVILNDGSFTRIPDRAGQRCTAIDLTMASPSLAVDAVWRTADDHLQSDHLPIHIEIGRVAPAPEEIDLAPKYQIHKADWSLFTTELTRECSAADPADDDTDVYLENIRQMILRAADVAIPKSTPKRNGPWRDSTEWWSDECDKAVAAKRKAMRTYKRDLTEANRLILADATKHCGQVIFDAKKSAWERFCSEEVQDPGDGGKVWQKLQAMRGRCRPPERSLLVNGKKTRTALEKAEALAETFAKASQSSQLSKEMTDHREAQERTFSTPVSDLSNDTAPYNSDLSLGELKKAINSLGSKSKATGKDPISYHMIRRFPDAMLNVLLKFYQHCWCMGRLPSAWREALVIALPKQGKAQHLPDNYRPIALTPHLGKVYERVIKDRLDYQMESLGVIPRCQAGFRKGRCCTEHVVRLVEHIKKAKLIKRIIVATFFDIKKAFDTVWHAKLLDKLAKLGVKGRLYEFVREFLSERRMAVKVGSAVSSTHHLDMGVPQGSVIAPLLFIIMLHDIVDKVQQKGSHISLFTDDLAMWQDYGLGTTLSTWRERYQKQVAAIERYMTENGFQLSAEKTTLVAFTQNVALQSEFSIHMGCTTITPSPSVRFLGVTLSACLGWGEHLTNQITKARRSVNLIKFLSGQTWVTPKSMVMVAHALVRSRLTYGQEAYFTAADRWWARLEATEMSALKVALGTCKSAVNDLVYQECGWLPLRDHVREA